LSGFLNLPLDYGKIVLLSVLVSVFGQLGDLVKSLLKRNMQVKDSGTALPGHGGFLDRTDSVLFTGVIAFYYALANTNGWLNWL
jgi:phosphatidate cytidylyltransferase